MRKAISIPVESLDATVIARFHAKTESQPNGCIYWFAASSKHGYGRFKVAGRLYGAHRIAWAIHHGSDVPVGLVIDHLCRTPCCVNPGHMEAVSLAENTSRGTGPTAVRQRLAAIGLCVNGHSIENREFDLHGRAFCRECTREQSRRYFAKPEARAKRNERMRRLRASRREASG